MKKLMLYTGLIVMMIAMTSFRIAHLEGGSNKDISGISDTSLIPDDAMAIFKISCMECHATGGRSMAMAKLNFSEWDTYSPEKQAKKAESINNVLTKETMPPKSFKSSHPEAVITDAQRDMIFNWTKSLTDN